jgi:hypothetical protein
MCRFLPLVGNEAINLFIGKMICEFSERYSNFYSVQGEISCAIEKKIREGGGDKFNTHQK